MPRLDILAWPYHAGLADVSMGLGASVLAADERFRAGLAEAGWAPHMVRVPPVDETLPEVARIFELARRLALRVADSRAREAFPLSCGSMPTPTSTLPTTTSPASPT